MSALTSTHIDIGFDFGSIFKLTVAQYDELADAGVLQSGDPVELLEGVLVQKMTRNPPHSGTVVKLRAMFESLLPEGWRYRSEQPLILADGVPEPDGVIARGTSSDNFAFHPNAADTILVIEVADTTLVRDRGIKLRSYARAGIQTYWIINLIDRAVEVHTDPQPTAEPWPTYGRHQVFSGDSSVELSIDGRVIATLAAAELLPPIPAQ